ncbi:DNA ligase 4-like isoform X1 [Leptidea sinapis]|uniref:DNA ligase 4-like isoform X1 n=1 Tax=Leptidea sinapis TaxID=189913 RepID=UPI0021377F0E|nr:DNA ligase 4-like isoform X1 [Leptidea sinapis]
MEATPANNIKFSDLCSVLQQIHKNKKNRHEQDKIVTNFVNDFRLNSGAFIEKKNSTFYPVMRLLLPDRDRERGAYNLKEAKLGALLVKVLSLNKQSQDAQKLLNFRSVQSNTHESDFANVAYFIFRNRIQNVGNLTIGDVNAILDKISAAEVGSKGFILDEAFSYAIKNMSAEQFKWFLRIILKDLKLKMGIHRILAAFHPDAPELFDSCANLSKVCEDLEDGDTRPLELGVKVFFAVSPMLSERLDVTRIAQLSPNNTYHIEDKFDGERFQMHMENGIFEYYSRKGFRYSDSYGKTYESGLLTPNLQSSFSSNATSFILDGEMMGWHKEYKCFGSKGMAYDIKKITENSRYRPCFCVFDILYYNGKSLIGPPEKGGLPLKQRLEILDLLFFNIPGVIQHSRRHIVKSNVDILNALNKAIENQDEGVVVKDVDSFYIANRRNAGWYKIKPEYTEGAMTDLDLVIIGADEAENKRQGRAKSFHVACADVDSDGVTSRWVCVGRVATGFTYEERETVCAHLERYWSVSKKTSPPPCLYFNKEKPDFWILPQHSIVLEVRATELVRSSGTGTEYTLRFPRVTNIRADKPVSDIMTLLDFQRIVAERNPVIKLSTKRISDTQIAEAVTKSRKSRPAKTVQVAEQFRSRAADVVVTSHALKDREVCVLSDDGDCKKTELIRIVESHGGKHVENPGPKTWCCIVGSQSFRTRRLIESNMYDVITASWLRSLPSSHRRCTLSPVDMLSIKKSTKLSLSIEYDKFGDSYKQPSDQDTLDKCLKKMDCEIPTYLTRQEMIEVDAEIFGNNNPFSFLRPCLIHVIDNDVIAAKARFFGANLQNRNGNLTHIVVPREFTDVINTKRNVHVVYEDWLEKCFEERRLCNDLPFLRN